MPDDSRNLFRNWSDPHKLAHPDSPAGGSGGGFSRTPGYAGNSQSLVHPDSPAGRYTDWQTALDRIQIEEYIVGELKGIDRAASASYLIRLATPLLGSQSFDLGVCYGIAQSVAGMAGAFAGLSKTFILAGLYDAAHAPFAGPLLPIRLEAKVLEWVFGSSLKTAHDQRDALVRDLGHALMQPVELLANASEGVAREYKVKWFRLQQFMSQRGLAANFEAGRVFGEVLVDVLVLISTIADVIKAAKFFAEIPELARLGRGLKSIGTAGGGPVTEEAVAGPVTRSLKASKSAQSVPEIPEPVEPAPPPEKPPLAETPKPILKNVSAAQVELAATAGKSEAQIAARKAVAESFYREYGMPKNEIQSHVDCIDLTKPVKARFAPPPESLVQWQPKGRRGRYFGSVAEDAHPKQLGIGEYGIEAGPPPRVRPKVRSLCKIDESTPMLESTAARSDDARSIPRGAGERFTIGDQGMVQGTTGGATQYYIPNTSKVTFLKE